MSERGEEPPKLDQSRVGHEIPDSLLQPPTLAKRLRGLWSNNKLEVTSNISYFICTGLMVESGRQANFLLFLIGFSGVFATYGVTFLIRSITEESSAFSESGSDQSGYIRN